MKNLFVIAGSLALAWIVASCVAILDGRKAPEFPLFICVWLVILTVLLVFGVISGSGYFVDY